LRILRAGARYLVLVAVAALQMMMLGAHSAEVVVSSRNAIRRPVELGLEGEKMTEQGTLIYIDSRN
jgi:hypothetical protein